MSIPWPSGPVVAVVGAGDADARLLGLAERVGEELARRRATLVCGGLGGVMAAACRGAKRAAGLTVGILPGADRRDANAWLDVAIPTGMGEARNVLVVRSADAVIAVGGGYGTLSEIALALKLGRRVVGMGTWELARHGRPDRAIVVVEDAVEAATRALADLV
ncbi:MAG: TIGR00725 family protein [Actinomycetota bacterium]|nr:TIGR00725 family protein [Actinomycetota bacterium]